MIVPQMLDPELVGRSPVECTELRYRTDVGLLGARVLGDKLRMIISSIMR